MFMQKPLFQSTLMSAFGKIYGDGATVITNEESEFDLAGKHVLLVEDHPLNVGNWLSVFLKRRR